MSSISLIEKARNIIRSVKGTNLVVDERKRLAVLLAAAMINESRHSLTRKEKKNQQQLGKMLEDPYGKVFTSRVTDQCFRSSSPKRVADQLVYLLNRYGTPQFFSFSKRVQLKIFQHLGKLFSGIFVPLLKRAVRHEMSQVIIPGEQGRRTQYIKKRTKEGVRVNINHLGEAILGEDEAKRRHKVYLDDLSRPEVEYISVKISTIFSQINLLDWSFSVEVLSERLRALYRAAINHQYSCPKNGERQKFVNLDMEEYRDLHLTVEVFQKVLDEPEFLNCSAGIVLQSYLPDSFGVQKKLTEWAMKRIENGGAPIKIRFVKGANLAMEKLEASIEGWPQAPYTGKLDVDANYKKMLAYAFEKKHAAAVHIGVASHNMFDIAYAMLLMSENNIEEYVTFEMLEGMADNQRRVVQHLVGDVLLYSPTATESEFVNAVAYLVRRLDENTAPDNFLSHVFALVPGSKQWSNQVKIFEKSCDFAEEVASISRRQQNRNSPPERLPFCSPFENESNTDWSLKGNQKWAQEIVSNPSTFDCSDIPNVIAGEEVWNEKYVVDGFDPSRPGVHPYRYNLASEGEASNAISTAIEVGKQWCCTPLRERSQILAKLAHLLREHRKNLIRVMVCDGGKTVAEADGEVSEAIDFCEYYRRNCQELFHFDDIQWNAKGVVLVTPPWNFPCAIPLGGIVASLVTGNSVIFKPAQETVLVGWHVAKLCWEAGVPKNVLQFIVCDDDSVGSMLIKDPRIASVILTGATQTAELFRQLRPDIDLYAETGGKNAIVVSRMADRDQAIKNVIESAFGHSGQKCSACSLLILEAELYDDKHFLEQLRDAAASLAVGSAWELKTKITPLINQPNSTLLRGLTELDKGEKWLLQPQQDPKNPRLWSPGIRLGVIEGSFVQQNELFGPVLGVMRVENFQEAVRLANATKYGLTSGVQSLDLREQNYWLTHIEAGNCYINRGITGAIVQRQPFGGCKASSFGKGAKAGGPNYLMQLMNPEQVSVPTESEPVSESVEMMSKRLSKVTLTDEEKILWNNSACNYAFYWMHYFVHEHDPTKLIGQDNYLSYKPRTQMAFRVGDSDTLVDVLRVVAAALTCHTPLEVSLQGEYVQPLNKAVAHRKICDVTIVDESEDEFIKRLQKNEINRLRILGEASEKVLNICAENNVNIVKGPVLINGRIELLNYLREMSISNDYHRYGNLGRRENEERKPIVASVVDGNNKKCQTACCKEVC
ncbi:MAG: proline dehydrogenase family protein [Chlamydiota bacterium]|nr:proline dehydrogenase family protein [Chlamydiota bacterium]